MNPSDEQQLKQHSARAYAPAWLTLIAGFIVSAILAVWFWREAEHLDRTRFQAIVTNLMEQLDARTARYAEELQRFANYLASQSEVSEATWRECISRPAPPGNLPGFVELAYATDPNFRPRPQVEALLQTHPGLSGRSLLPELDPPLLEITRHWRNACMVTAQETGRWLQEGQVPFVWWAINDGRLISSPRRLVPGLNQQPLAAVSLFAPIFAGDLLELIDLHSQDELWRLRAHRFKGMVIGTVRWQLFRDAMFATAGRQVDCEAFAGAINEGELSAENWMGAGGSTSSQSRVLKPGFRPRFRHIQAWPFYRTRWQLVFYSTPLFDKQSTRERAWVALGGGMSLSLLMAGLLAVQVRARRNQETISHRLRLALGELDAARKQREQLSYDLHDGAIQSLYALQLSLSRAAEQAHPPLNKRLSEIRRNLTVVLGELRAFILRHEAGARPSCDLASVLTASVERLRFSTETILCAQLSPEASRRLAGEQAVHLANLAREALSNALRHANAKQITVTLRDERQGVLLEIQDDGRGFDPDSPTGQSMGLTSLASRARQARGVLRIDSRPDEGTRVSVFVPLHLES